MQDPRLPVMHALTIEHYGRCDPRRAVFIAHATQARLRLQWALEDAGEVPAPVRDDMLVAAQGRDLYLDTAVTPDSMRERFGARVERMLDGLGNPAMQSDEYDSSFALVAEDLRLIRLAAVIENIAESTVRIRHLHRDWVAGSFVPLATNSRARRSGRPYPHFPRTAALLHADFDRQLTRLVRMVAAERELEASDEATSASLGHEERVLLWEERERREGWLGRGMRCFSTG
jgi:hypothetical protein